MRRSTNSPLRSPEPRASSLRYICLVSGNWPWNLRHHERARSLRNHRGFLPARAGLVEVASSSTECAASLVVSLAVDASAAATVVDASAAATVVDASAAATCSASRVFATFATRGDETTRTEPLS